VESKKRALLIGINYLGTPAELSGCVNDVKNIQSLLLSSGWRDEARDGASGSGFRVLTDAAATRANILEGVDWLVGDARRGDSLFFSYSGHGGQEIHPQGLSEDGMSNTLLPIDFQSSGTVLDVELSERLVARLPEGVKLTAVIDACHSGTALDLPWTLLPGQAAWREETNPLFTSSDAILLSGCADDQTSSDGGRDRYGRPGGALTTAFCAVMQPGAAPHSHAELLEALRMAMQRDGFSQVPQLSSSQAFEAATAPFTLGSEEHRDQGNIPLNRNPTLGQVVRRRFEPQPQPFDEASPLHAMLLDAGLFVTSEMVADALEMLFSGAGGFANTSADVPVAGSMGDKVFTDENTGGMFGGLLGGVGAALVGANAAYDDDDDDY